MTTKFTENELMEDKELREKLSNRTEVLDKAGELLLLPNTELLTTEMVANYFKVGNEAIKTLFSRNKVEFTKYGVKTLKGSEFQELKSEVQNATHFGRAGSMTVYTKNAVLIIAMMLTKSDIAERVREELVNQQKFLTDEQKVQGITDEQLLLLKIIQSDSEVDRAVSLSEYNNYKNRHIAELNVRIDEMKPKVESHDTFMDAKNYQSFNDAAKSIGIGRNTLMEYLRNKDILVKTGNKNIPYQQHINNGYFVVKQGTKNKGGKVISYATTYVTPKGIDAISKQLKKEGLI